GVGKEGSIDETNSHIMEEDARHLAEMLKNSRSGNIKVCFDYMPAENHATAGHPAIFNAFRLFYGLR
ncbi:MAG: alpha/beta hydrolase, partial [Taibaiella sp.]|nr:alpha/beta hydrolase [Taibaiella sp.]